MSHLLRAAAGVVLVVAVAVAGAAADEGDPRIEGLETRWQGDTLWAGYRVAGGLSDRVLERIHSGITTTFKHRIELVSRRALPLLPARVHARATIESAVAYDALTGQYELTRLVEIRRRGEPPRTEQTSEATGAEEEMRQFMLRVPEIGLYVHRPDEGEDRELHLRVESVLERRWVLLLFPSRVTASGDLPLP